MACTNVVTGMPINLSSTPPKCDHCVLGKQARSLVPKVWERDKATRHLGKVYVDLTGPMSIASRNGSLYAMNIINGFSSYTWTIPLKHKGDACAAIQTWHKAVENQTDEKLKIILTDNGELLFRDILKWCSDNGIEHQLTAPYTSSHNGRAERLHRTLLGKARAMRLACNAPASLWDKFVNTASYLTTLTASSTIGGKTPYEVWYGKIPSLSHLREIGCHAFALIMMNNPKVLQRSVLCVLIGYAPHSKAYRL
jgi:hypothetical protein